MKKTPWLPMMGIVTALVAFPGAAGAKDYCVAPDTTCGGTNVGTLEQALDLADDASDADRIFLGAATYTPPSQFSYYYYVAPSSPVEIIGKGEGQTILTNAPGAAGSVIELEGGAGSSIHDLTIRLPESAAAGYSGLTTGSPARRIEVIEDATEANFRYGARLDAQGTLEDSTVTLAGKHQATGVVSEVNTTAVRRSTVSAGTGITSYGGAIERSRITGSEYGIYANGGVTTLSESLIRLTGCCTGIRVDEAGSSTLNADGVTLVVPVSPDVVGVGVSTSNYATGDAKLTMSNSVIRGSNPLFAYAHGSGHAKISVSYSDYDRTGDVTDGANASIVESNVSNVGGDYQLVPGSPLVDAGDPATAQGLDLDGNPLVADGNGDGIARRDMGASELQPAPPVPAGGDSAGADQPIGGTPPADTVAPLVSGFRARTVRRATRFRFTLNEPARVVLRIRRALLGRYHLVATLTRSGKIGANSGRRALRPGRYRATIVATDAAGNRSAPKVVRFRVVRR
jgi:hypothetical protein